MLARCRWGCGSLHRRDIAHTGAAHTAAGHHDDDDDGNCHHTAAAAHTGVRGRRVRERSHLYAWLCSTRVEQRQLLSRTVLVGRLWDLCARLRDVHRMSSGHVPGRSRANGMQGMCRHRRRGFRMPAHTASGHHDDDDDGNCPHTTAGSVQLRTTPY